MQDAATSKSEFKFINSVVYILPSANNNIYMLFASSLFNVVDCFYFSNSIQCRTKLVIFDSYFRFSGLLIANGLVWTLSLVKGINVIG